MRKLSACLVVLVVFGICSPSFGYMLLYKVSTTVKGADDDTGEKVRIPLKGYLLLNINEYDEIADANLILYGKDTDGARKYVQLNHSDSDQLLGADDEIWYAGDMAFVGIWGNAPFDFEIFLSGKAKWRNVGLGDEEEKFVARSIKGVTIIWADFVLGSSADQDILGSANASATLWNAAVKAVNDPEEPWTQDEIIETGKELTGGHENSLIEILEGKDFEPATLP